MDKKFLNAESELAGVTCQQDRRNSTAEIDFRPVRKRRIPGFFVQNFARGCKPEKFKLMT